MFEGLRPYQSNDVDRLCLLIMAHRATLYALPTGGGKAVMFAELARRFERVGSRILIVVHRRELVRQAVEKLARAGVCAVLLHPISLPILAVRFRSGWPKRWPAASTRCQNSI
jgi:hypothetical protein